MRRENKQNVQSSNGNYNNQQIMSVQSLQTSQQNYENRNFRGNGRYNNRNRCRYHNNRTYIATNNNSSGNSSVPNVGAWSLPDTRYPPPGIVNNSHPIGNNTSRNTLTNMETSNLNSGATR